MVNKQQITTVIHARMTDSRVEIIRKFANNSKKNVKFATSPIQSV